MGKCANQCIAKPLQEVPSFNVRRGLRCRSMLITIHQFVNDVGKPEIHTHSRDNGWLKQQIRPMREKAKRDMSCRRCSPAKDLHGKAERIVILANSCAFWRWLVMC